MTLPLRYGGAQAYSARAIDLVNGLQAIGAFDQPGGGPIDEARGVVDRLLESWGEELDDSLAREVAPIVAVARELRAVLAATDRDEVADRLNELLAAHTAPPRLEREPGWDWHLHVDRPDAGWSGWIAAASAIGLAELFATSARLPWGRCGDPACGRFFLDHGRQGPQRYCQSRCATRSRVRRHRQADTA